MNYPREIVELMSPLPANFENIFLRPPSWCAALAPAATRGLLQQLGRTRRCSSLRNCPGSHRTIHLGNFLLRILHSNRGQGLQAVGLVPVSVPVSAPVSAPVWG